MSPTLKASKTGLAQVQQARKEKGWTVDNPRWLIEASKILSPETDWEADNCYYAPGCSETTWKRFLRGTAIGSATFKAFCQVLELNWEEIVDRNLFTKTPLNKVVPPKQLITNQHEDWGDAPDVPVFFGRETELATLKIWILDARCRLVAIVGMGGIGKTDLSLMLARSLAAEFEYVIWRSLLNAPKISEIITDLIKFLSNQRSTDIQDNLDKQISLLLQYLKFHRCLLILDNTETILEAGDSAGKYKQGYEEYGQLFEKIATVSHQSCLMLTSREKINKIARLEGLHKSVRFLELKGLHPGEGKSIFKEIGDFSASDQQWQELIEFYNGHPLALELTAHHIQDIFAGSIAEFLQEKKVVFADLRELLEWHFERLSDREKEIIYWLAIHREPVSLAALKDDIVSVIARESLWENLRSLQSKVPLEKSENGKYFTLQPVLMEYITDRFISRVCEQVKTGAFNLFNNHALMLANSKDYVREIQIRTILNPIKTRLIEIFNSPINLEENLKFILANFRKNSPLQPGYTGGNVFNLLRQLNTNLTNYDFSHLTLWQANFQGVNLHNINFTNSDLTKSVFTQSFGGIHALAFSPDGKMLAVGDSNGQIRLLRIEDEQTITTFHKHGWWTVSIAFSSDGEKLVSSSIDGTLKLWDVKTGKCLHNLVGHTNWVWTVAFSPNNQLIASGCNDNTIKVWDANTGECLTTLTGHKGWVLSVIFSPDGQTLISGSYDRTIKFWNVETGKCFQTFTGHEDAIWSVSINPDGKAIASSGYEKTIRLWDTKTGRCWKILKGHKKEIKTVAFSEDGKTLASGCFAGIVKFWDVETGECKATGKGHYSAIRSLAFNCDNQTVATGDNDQIIKLWNAQSGKCIKTFQGYTNWVWSVAFSPNGQTIASSHLDHTVRLWDTETGKCLQTFVGHTAWIWSVAFSPDGQTIASSGDDETIRLWDVNNGQLRLTLQYPTQKYQGGIWTVAFSPDGIFLASGGQDNNIKVWDITTGSYRLLKGHHSWIIGVTFSPNGKIIATGSNDQTIKIWDVTTGQCLQTLQGHTNNVLSVAFSPEGKFLISSSEDRTLKIWNLSTGECLKTLEGHTNSVWSVKFCSNGKFIVSGSYDRTLKLWEVNTGNCLHTWQEHTDKVTSVAFSPNNQTIISGSSDGTIKFWNVQTDKCLKTLRVPRPYEGMNITKVKGITDGQQETLRALGAVCEEN
ncbi:NB-ARC domain-containing protein [Aerosakkonemataceae cyanobacterium BLCC-F50]|uniref:NB-ARC domain-containing protein n=1 Tax=Floridaenema flaviceps BLCC-F50 TaxID=3153642 RepID=A0ABV4XIJ0_9CYAN